MDDHVHTNTFDEEFLRDILQQEPEEATAPVANPVLTITTAIADGQTSIGRPAAVAGSLMIKNSSSIMSQDSLLLSSSKPNQGTKKTRSPSVTLNRIMSERKRRQELTKMFIALSATIPGLKSMDKAYVLQEAIEYVKQLQGRVKELEEDMEKSGDESVMITITRSHLCTEDGIAFDETNADEWYGYGPNEAHVPEVEARVLGKEVLIKIHCGKQRGILLKILSQLERLHLSTSCSTVLPFGKTLDITIIAQMGDKYSLMVKDLVKSLTIVAMLKACDVQNDPR